MIHHVELLTLSIGSEQTYESRSEVRGLRAVQQLRGMGQGAMSNCRRGEEEGETLHDRLVKLRRLVGKP